MGIRLLGFLAIAWAVLLTWLGFTHPYGLRFALGIWPVPAGTPWTYQLESGFVPALTVLTLLSAITSLYHLHNCHADNCWRLGKHRIGGSPWCAVHMDQATSYREVAVVLEDILAELRKAGQ